MQQHLKLSKARHIDGKHDRQLSMTEQLHRTSTDFDFDQVEVDQPGYPALRPTLVVARQLISMIWRMKVSFSVVR